METTEQLQKLFNRYLNDECSASEIEILMTYFYNDNRGYLDQLVLEEFKKTDAINEDGLPPLPPHVYQHIQARIYKLTKPRLTKPTVKLWQRIAAVVAVLLIIGSAIFFYTSYYAPRYPGADRYLALAGSNIKPGSNKAILTLADGSTIALDNAANGTLAKQSGVQITKTANGQLIYEASSSKNTSLPSGISPQGGERGMALNTISIPRGGQYQVRLPDGSKVWLNAASKLTYPVSFKGCKERIIELSGEAYFEVAKDKEHPFHVRTTGQEVEVLGTHFNVSAYDNEPLVRTTLLEGAVKVSNTGAGSSLNRAGVRLRPGQQSVLANHQLSVSTADVEGAVAWKNGYFAFHDEKIESILRKISRWYNIEVEYEGAIPDVVFDGDMPRNLALSQVLKALEAVDIHFTLIGNKLIVKP